MRSDWPVPKQTQGIVFKHEQAILIHSFFKKKKTYSHQVCLCWYLVSDLCIWLITEPLWEKFTSSNKLWSRMCVNLLHFPFTSTWDHEEPLDSHERLWFVLTVLSCWAANTTIFRQLLMQNQRKLGSFFFDVVVACSILHSASRFCYVLKSYT